MATRSRLYLIVLAVVCMIIITMVFVQVKLPHLNALLLDVGKVSGFTNVLLPSANVTDNCQEPGDDGTPPVMVKVEKCDDLLCKKYLTKGEWELYYYCVHETLHPPLKRSEGPIIEQDPAPCTLHNGTAKKGTTLLVSFPGSGNTWLRGLLQQATGVCTGSVGCDMDLRRRGFPGEGIFGPSVLLAKAHFEDLTYLKHHRIPETTTSVVFLVRNPFNAIVAERTRSLRATVSQYWNGTHVNSDIHESQFGTNASWVTFLTKNMTTWKNMVVEWVIKFKGPLLVVKYEDLQADAVSEVLRILDFVQFDYNEESVRRALVQDFSRYQRKKHANFSHYTPEQEKNMLTMVNAVNSMLAQRNLTDLLSVVEYKI